MEKYLYSEQERAHLEGLQQAFAVYQFVNNRVVTLILSDGFCRLFEYEDRQKAYYDMDHNMYKDVHPDDSARIANAAVRFAKEDNGYDVVYRAKKKKDNHYHIIHSSGKHIMTESGVKLAHVWYIDEGVYMEDQPDRPSPLNNLLNNALHENSLVHSSQFDFLTGLPSMTYFFELAEAGRAEIEKDGDRTVMLFIDLSGMKFFNAKHGFTEGDALLRRFSALLSETFHNENCCHVSGDHFIVFWQEKGLEEKLRQFFRDWKEGSGDTLPVRVGIYPDRMERVPVSVAADRAKFACDSIRNTYESRYSYFDQKLRDNEERRQYIVSNIDRAIRENWIQVYYQPIVRAVNGHVCDEEALARWIDPVKGFLSPACFIPYLEESGQIYKLDLYMVEQVLKKMKLMYEKGFPIMPHSINFSRSDFDACDLVEEVRRRVDEAGISRDKITIEVTESAVGTDFEFMKKEILRFQELGFPVWMDDFGSGYSSLDVLSSIKFNLLKFDMIFMKKFDEEPSRKIILTELMRMATSLNVDTICEGVETESQVRFLQEIGCSKLQGFYFAKPMPTEAILKRYEKGEQIGFEDPEQVAYYEAMGRVNLYDLSAIANDDDNSFQNFFNTLPMCIMEFHDGKVRFIRSNPSYRQFMRRFFKLELADLSPDMKRPPSGSGVSFVSFIQKCCNSGARMLYDELMPDGSMVQSFARRVAMDPETGRSAIAVAVLSVTEPDEGTTYATIARALAADYYNIYYVDLKTDRFIEYSSPIGGEELAMERHGENFFEETRHSAITRVYEEDRVTFLQQFTKENILRELKENGSYTATYRMIDTGVPMYASMKITQLKYDKRHLIIGISIVDSQMKQHELKDTIIREQTAYARIMALSGGYISLYTVDPVTESYYEYSATNEFRSLGVSEQGENFFEQCRVIGEKVLYEEDKEKYLKRVTKENVLSEIRRNGIFQMHYRLMMGGAVRPVMLKIVSVRESDGEKLIVGTRLWRDRTASG